MNLTEHFIKGSDNAIKLTLTEDGSALSGSWARLEVWIGSLEIQRTSESNGIAFSAGVLSITPADLTEDLSTLIAGRLYRMQVVVANAGGDEFVFGGNDSANKVYFEISDKPV